MADENMMDMDMQGMLYTLEDEEGNEQEFEVLGELEFRTSCDENDLLYDEIGCGLKIRQLQQTKQELLEALQMYYKVLYVGI